MKSTLIKQGYLVTQQEQCYNRKSIITSTRYTNFMYKKELCLFSINIAIIFPTTVQYYEKELILN